MATCMEYNEVELMLKNVCWKFIKRYGGELDDLMSVANEGYARAATEWDSKKGTSFVTYCWWWVWGLLMRYHTKEFKHRSRFQNEGNDGEHLAAKPPLFSSEDADLVTRLVVNEYRRMTFADDLIRAISGRRPPRSRHLDDDVKGYLWDVLRLDFGWSSKRILDSFSEVKEVLA